MKKSTIILLVLFSLCCNKEEALQSELNAEKPTMLTEVLTAYNTVSCADLASKNEEDEVEEELPPSRYPPERLKSSKEYCLKSKTILQHEFGIRYRLLKNDAYAPVNNYNDTKKDSLEEIRYEKRFGTSISDFERIITHINFYIGGYGALEFANYDSRRFALSFFSVTKTATGAVAKYKRNELIEPLELELGVNEWLDFIRILYRSCISGWEKEYDKFCSRYYFFNRRSHLDSISTKQWKLECFLVNEQGPNEYYGFNGYPNSSNWFMFANTIDTIKSKMYRDAALKVESQLKIDYQKRFGKSITDMELSTANIYYHNSTIGPIDFLATRTTTGGFVEYMLHNRWFVANLDKNEWMDFIRNLYNGTKELEHLKDSIPVSDFYPGSQLTWDLTTYSLDKELWQYSRFDHRLTSRLKSTKIMNVITNMVEQVKMKDKQRQIDGKTDQAQKR